MTSIPGGFRFRFVLAANLVVLVSFFAGEVLPDTEFDLGEVGLSSMKLLGDAHMTNRSVRLTHDAIVPYSGSGKILYSKPIEFRRPGAKYPSSFSTFFTFSVANLNPSSIGGGLAFVISTDDKYVGGAGGYLGVTDANGAAARNGVVAVEFDTLMDIEFEDINGNHVGLDLNSMISVEVGDMGTVDVDLKSGDSINSWVDYTGSTQLIEVYVSYSNLKPKEPIISAIVDLNEYLMNDSYFVGFSGSTQGSTEIHTIDWWSFNSSFDENPISTPPPDLTNTTAQKSNPPPPSPAPFADKTNTTSHEDKNVKPGAIAGVVTASAFFLAFCAFAFIWAYNKKFKGEKNSENLASDIIKMPKEFSYKELKLATKGFDSDRIIGRGAFGTVYKGILPSTGDIVAVKRCGHNGQGKIEFFSELSIIGTLRHRNLVRLQGWCLEKSEILLVYDFMCNGSLDKALFESRIVLSWTHRRKILIGVASALAYLHQECENQVIHRDIKSSNVMLDEGFNARLGDFGLAKQIEHDKSPDATVAAGTMGYLAPEYLLTGRATEKTDAFSFGAVVLEVATGRRPIEKGFNGSNLVEWVWGLHRNGKLMAAVDPRLGNEFDEVEVRRALLVGLACSCPDPMVRPNMRRVVQMLLGDCETPIVPRIKPATTSFSTSQLLMTLQDSVSDLNGMISISDTSSENSLIGGRGGIIDGLDLV
ncbi:L-type lectin-domain containing receptor kinase VIII.1 [Orobanche minor]